MVLAALASMGAVLLTRNTAETGGLKIIKKISKPQFHLNFINADNVIFVCMVFNHNLLLLSCKKINLLEM